ncbi:lysozyme [Paraburkholderia sp. Ac-20347]|uniref:lysozyme n=1 Tax=Paraburkholderia sp. Ac-20347 TaxID=2703892 RepID=UPI00197F2300|nr:lysozyme [Paraburkholderia sp. Ac-20347]MBN3812485.1 lysozyme [Paraburkholderia sp. Ac-20347]
MPDALGSAVTNTNPNSCVTVQCDRLAKPWIATEKIKTFMAIWESGRLEGTTRIFYSNHTHIDVPVSGGFILLVYPDDQGNPTVGCGHLVVPEDNLRIGQSITVARARELLNQDLTKTERAINSKVHIPLHKYEYDALVSIIFNCGVGNGLTELSHRVNHGDYENIPRFITGFRCGNPRLRQRRRSESNVFAQGIYDASH